MIWKEFDNIENAPDEPLGFFLKVLAQAEDVIPVNANAMCLATVDPTGMPKARFVLLKAADERGFTFYTNLQSPKATELDHTPKAAICFYWQDLNFQIRVNGTIQKVDNREADAYFATRPRGSQIGAWASKQSQPLADRGELDQRIKKFENKYKDQPVPRPPHWGGFRLVPEQYEFWHQRDFRLHTRLLYTRKNEVSKNGQWQRQLIYP